MLNLMVSPRKGGGGVNTCGDGCVNELHGGMLSEGIHQIM